MGTSYFGHSVFRCLNFTTAQVTCVPPRAPHKLWRRCASTFRANGRYRDGTTRRVLDAAFQHCAVGRPYSADCKLPASDLSFNFKYLPPKHVALVRPRAHCKHGLRVGRDRASDIDDGGCVQPGICERQNPMNIWHKNEKINSGHVGADFATRSRAQ